MNSRESNNLYQRSWMTQHVVMTQRSCDDTGGDDLLRRMTQRSCDDRRADDTIGDDKLRLMTIPDDTFHVMTAERMDI